MFRYSSLALASGGERRGLGKEGMIIFLILAHSLSVNTLKDLNGLAGGEGGMGGGGGGGRWLVLVSVSLTEGLLWIPCARNVVNSVLFCVISVCWLGGV